MKSIRPFIAAACISLAALVTPCSAQVREPCTGLDGLQGIITYSKISYRSGDRDKALLMLQPFVGQITASGEEGVYAALDKMIDYVSSLPCRDKQSWKDAADMLQSYVYYVEWRNREMIIDAAFLGLMGKPGVIGVILVYEDAKRAAEYRQFDAFQSACRYFHSVGDRRSWDIIDSVLKMLPPSSQTYERAMQLGNDNFK